MFGKFVLLPKGGDFLTRLLLLVMLNLARKFPGGLDVKLS